MVVICVRQDVNLVSKDYYEQELKHQTKIDQLRNASELPVQPSIGLEANNLRISFSELPKVEKGHVKLMRPSNEKFDQELEIAPGPDTTRLITINQPIPGLYRIRMEWEMNGKGYTVEKTIVAP